MSTPDVPKYSIEVAFVNNPFDSSLTWTDITQYVEGFSTTMGRQHELQTINPSSATITLYNGPTSHGDTTGGRFSPWNTGSAYYHSGNGLTPGHPIRIQATWSSTLYNVFYGYTKAWVPKYGATKSEVELQCYDLLALLNLNTLDTGQYETTVEANALAYYQLSDPIGSPTAADSMGGTAGSVNGAVAFGQAGAIPSDTTTSALSTGDITVPATVSGTHVSVTGWVKTGVPTPGSAIIATYNGTNLLFLGAAASTGQAEGAVGSHILNGPVVADGGWHFLALTADGTTLTLYVDGNAVAATPCTTSVTSHTGTIGNAGGTSSPSSFAHIAVYNVALTPAQVAAQYQIAEAGYLVQDSGARISAVLALCGVPGALNNVGAGVVNCQAVTSPLSTTTALSYINTVNNTERGFFFQDTSGVCQYRNRNYVYQTAASTTSQATFGYSAGQLHYYSTGFTPGEDDLDLWNNIPVQRQGGLVQTAANSTSQTKYGRRTLTGYTSLLFNSDEDSADLAQFLLYQYANPMARVRAIVMDSTISNGANLPQMLGRNLLDRITINWRPIDGSGVDFSQQSLIEQVTHTVTSNPPVWSTTFAVTPIGTENFANYGTDVYGTGIYGP